MVRFLTFYFLAVHGLLAPRSLPGHDLEQDDAERVDVALLGSGLHDLKHRSEEMSQVGSISLIKKLI